ncbi:MAG TPA: 50S ribosomal protein L11 methyltransferase [Planctomycetota bacterium]|nr:50S ribosomal protein L11 methyltransferase [Planctomycetota bacterium]
MTAPGPGRAYEIRGAAAAQALDWLHVHANVLGVWEGDDSIAVWLAAPMPTLPQAGLTVREIHGTGADEAITGLERDTPIAVAPDLLVRPPWVERPAAFAGIELVVPRGGAFGSGEHASTRAALRCLHRLWDAPGSVADVGTGSGVLALYAVVRGCARVQACDIEMASVHAARALLPGAIVHLGGPETLSPADCVVANMTAEELHAALPAMLERWTRRSALVLCGLRAEEVEPMRRRLAREPVATETVEAFTALGFR